MSAGVEFAIVVTVLGLALLLGIRLVVVVTS